MALGGFFGQLGYQAGQNILYGQQQADQQATIDIKRAEAATMQMSALQKKQQIEAQQAIGQAIASDNALNGAKVTDPLQQAHMYDKAAGIATSRGDFATAKQMSDLANNQRQAAGEQAKAVAQQQHQNLENLATAADDLATNPTPDNYRRLQQATAAAGKNPSDIPPPGTPQFTTWLNAQKKAGMDSKQRAELAEKTVEFQQRQQERREEFASRQQEREADRALKAQMAAGLAYDREQRRLDRQQDRAEKPPTIKEFTDGQYEYDPSGKMAGDRLSSDSRWVKIDDPKLTSTQKTGRTRGIYANTEIHRAVESLMQFPVNTTNSPFKDLHAGSVGDALVKMGSNSLTPAQYQAMGTNSAAVGNHIASMDAMFGGRMAAGNQQQHLEQAYTPQPGDSGYTVAYKMAALKEMSIKALESMPGNYAKTAEGKKAIADWNQSVPFSTSDVLNKMNSDPGGKKAKSQIKEGDTYRNAFTREIQPGNVEAPLPGGGDPGAGVNKPPLPAGSSTVPKEKQDSLFAKYGLK